MAGLERGRCGLGERELQDQLTGYGDVGRGARPTERSARRIALEIAPDVDASQVEQLLAVERQCCPFLTIDWSPGERLLSFSVANSEQEAALAAIASALGIQPPGG
ncbi:MAG TPA: hypothetical protein VGG08_01340 [Solirubrobacteraceae bacterium]